MKANELRVGNYVSYIGNETRVTVISDGFVSTLKSAPLTYNQVDPIPLKKEWLLDLGFKKTKVPMKFNTEYIDYRMGQFVLFILQKGIVEVEFCAAHNKIDERGYLRAVKYVHELQNLYFALTGEELIPKKTP